MAIQTPADWVEVRRGFGEFTLLELRDDEFITASGLDDGGWIVWRKDEKRGGENGRS